MKRPVIVTVIGVITFLSGIVQAGGGALLIAARNNAKLLEDTKMSSGSVTGLGIALIAIGVLAFVFATGLLKGSRVARGMIGFSQLAGLAAGVYSVAALDADRRASGIGSIVGAVVVLYFLFGTDKAKAFFAKK